MPRDQWVADGLRLGCGRMPPTATAKADSSPPAPSGTISESRAAGRSDEIPHAQEFKPMTQSTTRPTVAATNSTRRIGRIVRANLSTAELYEDAVRGGEVL